MADRFDAARYWSQRYRDGRTSGAGSEGEAAQAKANKIAPFIRAKKIRSVIDWGVGDGTVMEAICWGIPRYVTYIGTDIAGVVLSRLKEQWAHLPRVRFYHAVAADELDLRAELALSLDVMFHLVDNDDYHTYLERLFDSATRFVIVHSSNHDGGRTTRHVRWRRWTPDVPDGWRLALQPPDDPAEIGWYIYERTM